MTIHAHPDDESSKGAGSVALYSDAGVTATLVCCTGGEEGDILNPAMDRPEIKQNIAKVRQEELAKAANIIGYKRVHYLGYRDSGMPDTPKPIKTQTALQMLRSTKRSVDSSKLLEKRNLMS